MYLRILPISLATILFVASCKKKEDNTTTSTTTTQPVCVDYNGTNLPMIGDEFHMVVDSITKVDLKSAGKAQTWDFSALLTQKTDTAKFTDPKSNPLGGNYPTANLYAKMGNMGLFLNKTNTGTEALGAYLNVQGIELDVKLNDTYFFVSYPTKLNDNISDKYSAYDVKKNKKFKYNGFDINADSVVIRRKGSISKNYDACGSLKTPKGTYDVLRAYVVEESVDTVDAKASLNPMLPASWIKNVYTSTEKSYRYEFYSDKEKLPIATVHVNSKGEVKKASYLK